MNMIRNPFVLMLCFVVGVPLRLVPASPVEHHLLPVAPNFDTLAPYGEQYAKICEKLLFPASPSLIRYFQVNGDPPYNTAIAIYRTADGSYRLMFKQAEPTIGDIVINAYDRRVDLLSALSSIKIKTFDYRIPSDVASDLQRAWLALLRTTRERDKADDKSYIHSPIVILSAADRDGVTRSGKYPPDAAKHKIFVATEAIVDDLAKSCEAASKNRLRLLRSAARRARNVRTLADG